MNTIKYDKKIKTDYDYGVLKYNHDIAKQVRARHEKIKRRNKLKHPGEWI